MTFALYSDMRPSHPVDRVEHLAFANDWIFDRQGSDEILISVDGQIADYKASFTWMEEPQVLHLGVSFELPVPESRKMEALKLLALVNEQLWVGHFDLFPKDQMVMYRAGLTLAGGIQPTEMQCEAMLLAGAKACDRYYQAFQFCIWGGKSAKDALECSLFETVGRA
jgi:hypothetical protein